jgi:hypothetical protein
MAARVIGDTDHHLDELITRADLDGLVRLVDDRSETADWDGLLRLRDRARRALDSGRQLWPAATLAEYRLALLAPPPWVGAVLTEDAGHFAIGPLTEVAAQHRSWDELAPHLPRSPRAAFVAHERVIRGEDLSQVDLEPVLDLPQRLQPWEPVYAVAQYEPGGATFASPPLPDITRFERVSLVATEHVLEDEDVTRAVRDLLATWTVHSNGRVDVAMVEGNHLDAISALGVRVARVAPLSGSDALAQLAWAGASGGAHGRRRGAAAGRFGAWWTAAAIVGVLDDWPIPPADLGELVGELDWFAWDAAEPHSGWRLQLAVWDPLDEVAWAISARDEA